MSASCRRPRPIPTPAPSTKLWRPMPCCSNRRASLKTTSTPPCAVWRPGSGIRPSPPFSAPCGRNTSRARPNWALRPPTRARATERATGRGWPGPPTPSPGRGAGTRRVPPICACFRKIRAPAIPSSPPPSGCCVREMWKGPRRRWPPSTTSATIRPLRTSWRKPVWLRLRRTAKATRMPRGFAPKATN